MINLPREYVIQKFYEYSFSPLYNKFNNVYQGGCFICKEGGSFGKKRRFYYIPENDNLFCHNCGWSSRPLKWVKKVTGCSDTEIIEELKNYSVEVKIEDEEAKPTIKVETLPTDSINLFDELQRDFYNSNDIVRSVRHLIKERRLDTAVNRPDSLYLSLTDRVHKNRLVIPFVNEKNSIEFYQTRTVLNRDNKIKPKYLGKVGSEKTLFNIDRVTNDHDKVYVFEGPINAFFTKNSIAVAGITERGKSFTQRQQQQFDNVLKFFERVWILDSQWIDRASLIKSEVLLKQMEKVFIWPEKFGKRFKDFNDIVMACKLDEIKWDFIQNNTFEGIEGIIKLTEIKKYSNLKRT